MVSSWHKYLNKLNLKQKIILKEVIFKLISLDFINLDITKIKWEKNIYRCRVWDTRIIYENLNNKIIIKKIWPRWDIYK